MSKLFVVFLLMAQVLEPLAPEPARPSPAAAPGQTATAPEQPQAAPSPAAAAEPGASADGADTETAADEKSAAEGSTGDGDESAASAATGDESVPVTPEPTLWEQLATIADYGALYYLFQGGLFMWVLLALGILAAGVAIERFRSLQLLQTDHTQLRQQVLDLLSGDEIEEAIDLCDREEGPVAAILGTGLRKFLVLRRLRYDAGRIEEQVVKSMDDYGVHITAALERHLPILATVSSVAPMLGFLGTVQGMVVAFQDIVAQLGKVNIVEAAAAGIQVSLLTTVMGLIVGIPAFIAYNYFTSVINRFVLDVEASATELIEGVTLQMALRSEAAASDGATAAEPALTAQNGH